MRISMLLPLLALPLLACKGTPDEEADPNYTLTPGFEDDTRGPFTSSGEVEDTTCGGWFPEAAQHQVELTENFLALHFLTDTVDAPAASSSSSATDNVVAAEKEENVRRRGKVIDALAGAPGAELLRYADVERRPWSFATWNQWTPGTSPTVTDSPLLVSH